MALPLTRRPTHKYPPRKLVRPPSTILPPESAYPSYAQMLAQAQALAAASQAGTRTLLQEQQQAATARASRSAEQQSQIAAALAKVLQGIGPQVQAGYQAAGNTQALFGKGFSDGLKLATQGSADETNAFLRNVVGAPEGQQIPSGQATQAADVLYGVGGYLPAQSFAQQGAALAAGAAGFPMQAVQQGQAYARAELEKGKQAAQDIGQQLMALAAERPILVQSYLERLQSQRNARIKDDEARAVSLYNSGLITERELARKLRLPNWRTYANTLKTQANLHYFGDKTGGYFVFDPDTGKAIQLAPGSGPVPKTISQGGFIWAQQPNGTFVKVGGAGPSTNLQHVTVNGKAYAFDPKTGAFLDARGNPTVPSAAGAKVSAATMARARKLVAQIGKSFYAAAGDPSSSLSLSALRGMVSSYNSTVRGKKDPNTKKPYTLISLADVYAATPDQLKVLGLTKGSTDPQSVYLQLVQMGIPAKRAWQMVRSKNPTWGKGYFSDSPKDSAAHMAAHGGYDLPAQGDLIGTPYSGTHTLGNWESDNAVDIAIPVGTPIYAVTDGVIGPKFGSQGKGGRFAGLRLHLITRGNEFFYSHLSRFAPGLKRGVRVKKGQLLGYSGEANGVAHLHFGMRNGNPLSLYGQSTI